MNGAYHLVRHADDTGHEAIIAESYRLRTDAERRCQHLQAIATHYGAAVTYRVLEPVALVLVKH